MPVTVGLQNAGSFQVSGWPYINTATLSSTEQEFTFNFISQEITIWNAGGEDLKFYFSSASPTVFILPSGKKVTLRVKAGSIFALSEQGTQIKLFVSMTNVSLERMGVIPSGSPAGPIPDADGDGTPDYGDIFPRFFGEPPPDSSEWDKSGTEDLWMEISGSQEFSLDPVTYYLGEFIGDQHPVLYPGLEAYFLNADGDTEDYTVNIESPIQSEFNLIDTNTPGTYTANYKVSKEDPGNPGQNIFVLAPRSFIVLQITEPEASALILTYQMEPASLFETMTFQGPTDLDDLNLTLPLEVNEYEEV
jgi:hypothetical protein